MYCVKISFVASGRFVCSALKFVLNAVIYRILFLVFLNLKPSISPIQSATHFSQTEIKQISDEMSLHSKLKVIVEMKLKVKIGVILWKTKKMYNLEEEKRLV
jgi:hypothetical protein